MTAAQYEEVRELQGERDDLVDRCAELEELLERVRGTAAGLEWECHLLEQRLARRRECRDAWWALAVFLLCLAALAVGHVIAAGPVQ